MWLIQIYGETLSELSRDSAVRFMERIGSPNYQDTQQSDSLRDSESESTRQVEGYRIYLDLDLDLKDT